MAGVEAHITAQVAFYAKSLALDLQQQPGIFSSE
jgi:hypothetical protein